MIGKAPDRNTSGHESYLVVLEVDGELNSKVNKPHSRTDAAARMN